MYRNAIYNSNEQAIKLFTWDEDGKRVLNTVSCTPYLYVDDPRGEKTSIFGTKVRKKSFNTAYDRYKFVTSSGIKRLYENLPAEQQYLIDTFCNVNETPEFTKLPLKITYIDIETYSVGSFPNIDDPTHVVNVITCYDTLNKQYFTFGLKPYINKSDNVTYIHCKTERELFTKFIEYLADDYPDVLTGWNCLEENQHIWLKDRIIKIKDLSNNYESKPLKTHGICINNFMNTGNKDEYKLTTEHGDQIRCSIDHKFMVYTLEKGKYSCYNVLTKNLQTLSVKEIIKLQDTHYVYFTKYLNNNKNKDLTYRDLIENSERLKKYIVSTNLNVYTFNFTKTKRINSSFDINIDEIISPDILKLLGFIFTDGTFSKTENTFRYTNKYKNVVDSYTEIYNKEHNTDLSLSLECNTVFNGKEFQAYSKQVHNNNKLGILFEIIYNESLTKQPNIELISRLSYNQFMLFLSGMIDGDGSITADAVLLCNYDCVKYSFLNDLQELLLWNGIQSSVNTDTTILRIAANTLNKQHIETLNLFQQERKTRLSQLNYRQIKNTASNNISWYSKDDKVVVRLKPVLKTGNNVQMYDITTETHTFLCKGIHTHNCSGFDIPYIVNRCERILSEEYVNMLSPLGKVHYRTFMGKFGREQKRYFLDGISVIDYLDIYRRFCLKLRESYKLDAIGELELGQRKIDYGDIDLATLSDTNWQTFVDYNIQDVNLVIKLEEKLQYISLLRMLSVVGLTTLEGAMGTLSVINGALAIKARARGEIISTFIRSEKPGQNPGAYVATPKKGFKTSVVSFDANSLYPNVMISLNLSPETKIGKIEKTNTGNINIYHVSGKCFELSPAAFSTYIKQEQCAVTKAGFLFSQKKRGIIPEFLDYYYNERVLVKELLFKAKTQLSTTPKNTPAYTELQYEVERLNTKQMVIKVLVNSCYGYMGNKQAPIGDDDIASSVTLTGQAIIKQAGKILQDYLKINFNVLDEKVLDESWVYSDTDSYTGDTQIVTNRGTFDAAALWDEFISTSVNLTTFGHEVQKINDLNVLSYDKTEDTIKFRKVKNLIRHKVTKGKYKITVNNKNITMTEDHGCIVIRNGDLVRVSAKEIQKGDKMIVRR